MQHIEHIDYLSDTDQCAIQEAMEEQVGTLRDAVKGRVIVGVEREREIRYGRVLGAVTITLDGGKRVRICDTDECCAYGEVEGVNVNLVGAVVTDVTAEDGFERWFILGESRPIAELNVSWGVGNYPYYMFGLEIQREEQ